MRLPFWPIALFTLWDFYYAGIRPFDQIAVALLLAFVVLQPYVALDAPRILKFLYLLALVIVLIVIGALQHADAWKPSVGMIEGILAAAIISGARWDRTTLVRGIQALILIHGAAEILQLTGYALFHYTLNYQAWLGAEIRTFADGFGIRPTGLFQEPAEVSLMMFSLLTLFRLIGGKNTKVELFALVCMWTSLSLWGWGGTAVYLTLFRPRWALVALPLAGIIGAYLLVKFTAAGGHGNVITTMIINRAGHLAADPSANSRYGALGTFNFSEPIFWFGQGVTDDYELYGANGISFILSVAGIFGTIVSMAVAAWILPAGNKLRALICVAFMLSAMSQWTFVWWYVWLALASFGISSTDENLARRHGAVSIA